MIEEERKNKLFNFMLKEYEMLYSKFEMHYNAVEKTIGLYFLIIGAIISAGSVFIKDFEKFSVFNLTQFQIFSCFFISIVGTISLFKVIEHRLLIITYVKNLNQNRKWFNTEIANDTLQGYSLFHTSFSSPKYYKKYRHFYWEVMGIATINSSFLALFIINLAGTLKFESPFFIAINWFWFIFLITVSVFSFMKYYKFRGNREEKNLKNRKDLIK